MVTLSVVIAFSVNSNYIFLAFSFLLLSYTEKKNFVINGSKIYVSLSLIIINNN